MLFKRLHGATTYPGTGIGLTICKKIVEKHNGRIYATSKPGEGTKFTIELPVYQKKAEPDATSSAVMETVS